jgi:hypothetical protein
LSDCTFSQLQFIFMFLEFCFQVCKPIKKEQDVRRYILSLGLKEILYGRRKYEWVSVCVCVCVCVCVLTRGLDVVEAHKYNHMWHWEYWKVPVLPVITVLSAIKEDTEAIGNWSCQLE